MPSRPDSDKLFKDVPGFGAEATAAVFVLGEAKLDELISDGCGCTPMTADPDRSGT
jgi:hypothetical protein